jgi:hypothetical protein
MVMQKMGDRISRRFFFRATPQQIWDWIACMMPHPGFHPQQNINMPSFSPKQVNIQQGNPQQENPYLNPSFINSFTFFGVNPRPSNQ